MSRNIILSKKIWRAKWKNKNQIQNGNFNLIHIFFKLLSYYILLTVKTNGSLWVMARLLWIIWKIIVE